MTIDSDELRKRFWSHELSETQVARCNDLRKLAQTLAAEIVNWSPASREQSIALTKLEECSFWANAAIAREGK